MNWTAIAQLYDALARVEPAPVVEVNRAFAVGRARGAEHGLAALRPALDDPRLAAYVPLHAAHPSCSNAPAIPPPPRPGSGPPPSPATRSSRRT